MTALPIRHRENRRTETAHSHSIQNHRKTLLNSKSHLNKSLFPAPNRRPDTAIHK